MFSEIYWKGMHGVLSHNNFYVFQTRIETMTWLFILSRKNSGVSHTTRSHKITTKTKKQKNPKWWRGGCHDVESPAPVDFDCNRTLLCVWVCTVHSHISVTWLPSKQTSDVFNLFVVPSRATSISFVYVWLRPKSNKTFFINFPSH